MARMHMSWTAAVFCLVAALFVAAPAAQAAPLTVGATYTISVAKLNSDGTLSAELASTTAVADANGKLVNFSLTGLPDQTTCNFLLFSVKDGSGATVRRALAPTAPAGGTVDIGICDLTETQAGSLLAMAQQAGSDDPILMAFAFVIVRASGLTGQQATYMGQVGAAAITSPSAGFTWYLTSQGVTTAELAALRSALLNNATVDLRDFTALFKDAVEATTTSAAQQKQGEAGGKIAEIFIAAAQSAGIDTQLIINALSAAGDGAQGSAAWSQVDPTIITSISGAMDSFHGGLSLYKVKADYTAALTLLGASGSQVTRFLTALADFATAQNVINQTYEPYFENPGAYTSDQLTAAMAQQQTDFNTAWSNFQTAIQSTDAEVTALKASLAPYFGGNVANVPNPMVQDYTPTGSVNLGINKAAALNWVLTALSGGGSISYTPLVLTSDENTLLNATYNGQCMNWVLTNQPTFPPSALRPFMRLQYDIQICQSIEWAEQNQAMQQYGQHFPGSVDRTIKEEMVARLALRAAAFTGTTDGTTAITAAQSLALMKLLTQPEID